MGIHNHFNERVNIFDALDKFGIRYSGRVEQTIRCPSPVHNDSTPSAHIYPDGNIIKCFGCHKTFGVLNLYMEIYDISLREAIVAAGKDFNVPYHGLGIFSKVEDSFSMDKPFNRLIQDYLTDPIVVPVVEYVTEIEKTGELGPAEWYVWAMALINDAIKTSEAVEEFKYEIEKFDCEEDKWLGADEY